VAAKGGVPVVPISLIGTGNLMPNGLEWSLRPGCVKVVMQINYVKNRGLSLLTLL
jgi:1-acyl-sn-glycerol-3-phosphate acyltransferase